MAPSVVLAGAPGPWLVIKSGEEIRGDREAERCEERTLDPDSLSVKTGCTTA